MNEFDFKPRPSEEKIGKKFNQATQRKVQAKIKHLRGHHDQEKEKLQGLTSINELKKTFQNL